MTKKKIIALVVALILVAGFISLFPRKVKFQETISACTYEGETISAEFDVELWKYWYMQDDLKGSITVGNKTYEPVDYEGGSENRFWFAVPVDDATRLHDNMLYVDMYGTEFEIFLLMLIEKEEKAYAYFGPAETPEEVEKVIKSTANAK
ncbi:MAG: hypothetical protein J6K15_04135 [Lachnospiraceae bacterium]|nr:hypothetical protein [Lachnospiraceae bacterium]